MIKLFNNVTLEEHNLGSWNAGRIGKLVGGAFSKDHPTLPINYNDWVISEYTPEKTPEELLQEAKSAAEQRITEAYNTIMSTPVASNGYTWFPGTEVALRVDRAVRHRGRKGSATVTMFTYDGQELDILYATAELIRDDLADIALAAEENKTRREIQIAGIDANPNKTVEMFDLVVW